MRPSVPILRVIFDVFEYQIMFNCSFFSPVDDLLGCLRSLLFQIKYFIMYNILYVKYFCGDELELRPRTKGPIDHALIDGSGPKMCILVKKP